jgi:hypothetical protein
MSHYAEQREAADKEEKERFSTPIESSSATPYYRRGINNIHEFFTHQQIRGFDTTTLEDIIRIPAIYSPAMVAVARHEVEQRLDAAVRAVKPTPNPKHATPYNAERTNTHNKFREDLQIVLAELQDFLVQKNIKYGDSALTPTTCFSRNLTPLDGINIRLDDKIKRLMTGDASEDEDVELDIIGYLIIKRIYLMRVKKGT